MRSADCFRNDRPTSLPRQAADRLRQHSALRGSGYDHWSQATVGIVGCGVVGGRLALELVRSGVSAVQLWDFDQGGWENLGTQAVVPGMSKALSLAASCEAIRAGVAWAHPHDVRHAGLHSWLACDVLVDCSDDPALAWSLTETANGLRLPLVRSAVDGSGQWELGRVLCSLGTENHACQLCSYSLADLGLGQQRTPCPGHGQRDRPPTLAGGAIAAVIAGVTMLQLQRLLTGNDWQRVVDREVVLDLTHGQLHELRLPRSPECLSGHVAWNVERLACSSHDSTLRQLFAKARDRCDDARVTLSGYQHPLNVQTCCPCGQVSNTAGTDWASAPRCDRCGAAMDWLVETQVERVDELAAERLGILDVPLARLGFPEDGALFQVRWPGRRLERWLLASSPRSAVNHET